MFEIELHFNIARSSTFKVAKFKDPSTKNRYVEAECRDLKCKSAYLKYQSASLEDRPKCAAELDTTRWLFYKKWAKENNIIPITNKPFKGDVPA